MEAYKNKFTTTELLLYKEVLCDEATKDWCAQRDLDEVESQERNCMRLAHQLCLVTKKYRERYITYVLPKPYSRTNMLKAIHVNCKLIY